MDVRVPCAARRQGPLRGYVTPTTSVSCARIGSYHDNTHFALRSTTGLRLLDWTNTETALLESPRAARMAVAILTALTLDEVLLFVLARRTIELVVKTNTGGVRALYSSRALRTQ